MVNNPTDPKSVSGSSPGPAELSATATAAAAAAARSDKYLGRPANHEPDQPSVSQAGASSQPVTAPQPTAPSPTATDAPLDPAVVCPRITFEGPANVHSMALTGLFVLALFYTFFFVKAVLMPITLALLFNFLLRPVIARLEKLHIRAAFGAAVIMLLFFSALGVTVYELSRPAMVWMGQAPNVAHQIERRLHDLRQRVAKVQQAAAQVNQMTNNLGGDGAAPAPRVVVRDGGASLGGAVFTVTRDTAAQAVTVIILLYFLLVYGDFFLLKVIRVMPTLADKKRAVSIARTMEQQISTYLFTVTCINVGLGVSVSLALWFIGMPNPMLWGFMVTILNFIPYLGATVGIIVVTVVSLLTFENFGHALLAPAAYLALASLEGSVVTPFVLGHRLPLNPVVIFIWLLLWGWLWGIPGALLAVPMLAAFKIFCDHIEPLSTVGEFLGH